MSRTDEIRERLNRATPGPWINPWENRKDNAITDVNGNEIISAGWYDGPKLMISQLDADFIASAPEDIKHLLEENAALKAERDELKRALELLADTIFAFDKASNCDPTTRQEWIDWARSRARHSIHQAKELKEGKKDGNSASIPANNESDPAR